MFSLFILYSNDRLNEFNLMLDCLKENKEFFSCQKILCVDGISNSKPEDFHLLEMPRPNSGLYCWAKMWDEAMKIALFEKVIYMDSDRILPINGLLSMIDEIEYNRFVFPKFLYQFNSQVEIALLRNVRDDLTSYMQLLRPDHRVLSSPWDSIRCKNPMSGCVGFTKSTFLESGGLDHSFEGWGYPDTDFFEKTTRMGCEFFGLDINELHLCHKYDVTKRELKLMNLWNGCKFCKKWNYPIHPRLQTIADEVGVPLHIVKNSMKKFLDLSKISIMP